MNLVVFVTREYGGIHLGGMRFDIITDLTNEVLRMMKPETDNVATPSKSPPPQSHRHPGKYKMCQHLGNQGRRLQNIQNKISERKAQPVQEKDSISPVEAEAEVETSGRLVITVLLNEIFEIEATTKAGSNLHALTPTALDDLSPLDIILVMIKEIAIERTVDSTECVTENIGTAIKAQSINGIVSTPNTDSKHRDLI